jgi:hypothetical protein
VRIAPWSWAQALLGERGRVHAASFAFALARLRRQATDLSVA